MRSSSAYLSAIATAALVLVALGLLVSVTGTLLPFGDWERGGDHEASTTIHAPPARSLARKDVLPRAPGVPSTANRGSVTRSAKARPPAGTRPARRKRDARPRRAPAGPAPPVVRRPAAPPVRRPVAIPPAAAPQPERPARPEPAAQPPPAPAMPSDGSRRPGPIHRVTNGVGDATRDLAETTGAAVAQLNPGLGGTVTEAGRDVADVVRGLGGPPVR